MGRVICVVTARTKTICGAPATWTVEFGDKDRVGACEECALHLQAMATGYGTNVKLSRIK